MIKDYFGKNCEELKNKKLFLFDMDGTIYNDNTIFDGTLDMLSYIKSIGGKYIFVTNNSSKSVEAYIEKVRKMGIEADEDNFYTSTQCLAMYILEKFGDQLIYASGTKSFLEELKRYHVNYTTECDLSVKAIVMGYDTELDFEKITTLSYLLTKLDVPYLATNPDLVCPVSFGYVPDCGSIAIILKNATGKYPIFMGKPEPTMIGFVMKKYNYSKEETVLFGDRIYTDIASGLNAGVASVLVLSGEATLKTIEEDDRKPTYVFNDIKEIYELIKNG